MVYFLTGATGFVGSRLAELALKRGDAVRTFTRSDWSGQPAVPIAHRFFGVLPSQLPPGQAFSGVDAVVHCAAGTESDEASSFAVNVAGSLNLARAAMAAGVRTFIFISSQSAQAEAISAYGRSKYAAEQALLQLENLKVVILRPGLVCGAGSRGLFQKMCNMVAKLPVIPLLGGGRAIVQPIHLDDLCAAVFESAARADELAGSVLNLGDAEGLPLAEFLQVIARKQLGKKKPALSIPLWPIETAVRAAEGAGLPLPINSNNLKGLKVVSRMETASDLRRLGLQLRSVEETVEIGAATAAHDARLEARAVRTILIGGGRIGLVHALTLWRSHGSSLVGIVDTKRSALNLLKGMGLPASTFESLADAVAKTKPDAAVIATPTSTHLPLGRKCLQEKMRVLIEKPLCVHPEQLEEFRQLDQEFPDSIQVGYVMPRNPQVGSLLDRLRAGDFGPVKSFLGLTLHAHILHPDPKRWEVQKKISGGGVLINSGGHLLSMIHAAFGVPEKIEAQSLSLHSTEVEDSLVATFTYPGFSGQQLASWSVAGFQRQENRLVIWTGRGTLILTASAGMFINHDGTCEICHQLDFDVGFNLAPDYAGAGFSQEMHDLARSVRTGQPAPMNVREAIRVEEMLFQTYANSRLVKSFAHASNFPVPEIKTETTPRRPEPIKRILDLRDVSSDLITRYLTGSPAPWDGYEITADYLRETRSLRLPAASLRATVPNFLLQSRLLMAGRYLDIIKRMGPGGFVRAGTAALPVIARARGVSFWAAAMGLLAGDLAHVPADFEGALLLHSYLADLALALRQTQVLEKMLRLCQQLRPRARLGFHTNLAREATATLPLMGLTIQEISILSSPSGIGLTEIVRLLKTAGEPALTVTAEVGPGPAALHQEASLAPQKWTHGAQAILLGPMADRELREMVRREKAEAWDVAFPGIAMPEVVL